MKTPDEIKKGMEYLSTKDIVKKLDMWKEGIAYDYAEDAASDGLAYMQQLEAGNAQMNRCIENMTDKLNAAHEEVAELKAQVPKWISVEDEQKPLHGHDYLCLCTLPDDPTHEWDWVSVRLWYDGGSNGYVDGPHFSDEGVNGMRVTHWMPLPEPPKEDA